MPTPQLVPALLGFWNRYPALLYGLSAWLGCMLFYQWSLSWLLPAAVLWLPALAGTSVQRFRTTLAAAIALACLIWTASGVHEPSVLGEGTALIEIQQTRQIERGGRHLWAYRGVLRAWEGEEGETGNGLPISLIRSGASERLRMDRLYLVHGRLAKTRGNSYRLRTKSKAEFKQVGSVWSLSESRYSAKRRLQIHLRSLYQDPKVGVFLTGLATGEFDDQMLVTQFGRFGLQHIMAISGFHFGIIASIVALLLRAMFPPQRVATLLIAILTSYYLFIGCAPSVQRAWLTAIIALGGLLLQRRASSLNTLGVAMLAILVSNPASAQYLGFQFSFLTTGAILLLYPPLEESLRQIWPKRRLSQAVEMPQLDQHGYLLITALRHSVALTLAVHLAAVPLLLFKFQKFPLLSMLYNLFYPFLVSIALFLLLLSLIVWLAYPGLAQLLAVVNEAYCKRILNLVTEMPLSLDFVIRMQAPPVGVLGIYLIGLFGIGIYLHHQRQSRLVSVLY